MVSNTQQFERIRKRKATTNGKHNKRVRRRLGTPVFAIHPVGYDLSAPDAKRPVAEAASNVAAAAPRKAEPKAEKAPKGDAEKTAKKPAAKK